MELLVTECILNHLAHITNCFSESSHLITLLTDIVYYGLF